MREVLRRVRRETVNIVTWMVDDRVELGVLGDIEFLVRIWFMSLIVEGDP